MLEPNNPYSARKAGGDMVVRSYNKTYGLFTLITRSSNNFGPHQHPEKFIPSVIINGLKDKKIRVYGDGLNIRDWLFVVDNCRAIDMVLNQGKKGEIYNIGAGNEKTNIEIVKLILKELDKPDQLISFVEDRLGHDRRYSLDSEKVLNLGGRPKFDLLSALRKTIGWYEKRLNK